MRYCSGAPNCPNLVTRGRCLAHRRQQDTRPNAETRQWYHSARWLRLRAQVLREEPLCCDCLVQGHTRPATDADHEIPHRGDPALMWDRWNLRSRCHSCHSRKTQSGQ